MERIHDGEPDLSEAVVRGLLQAELPELAAQPLSYVRSSGTTNALFRVTTADGPDVALRLPRTASASDSVAREAALLPALAATEVGRWTRVPTLLHHGQPTSAFPYHWAALAWLEGSDLWEAPQRGDMTQLAADLGRMVIAMADVADMPVPDRAHGERGGPIEGVLATLDGWLSDPRWSANELIDVAAVQRLADEARELVGDGYETGFVHGDLIPGNILMLDNGLSAVIDWGAAGYGDLAQDLAPAWAIFDEPARDVFRAAAARDEATWLRARTNELEHTVGAILYYRPRGHALADVMTRTLDRILSEG